MTRARELANFADNTAGLETLTVSDITDLSVSASNINSATNQITDSSTDLNIDSNTLVVDKSENKVGIRTPNPGVTLDIHDADPAIDLYDTGANGFCRIDANGANLTLHADKGANSSSSTIKFGVDNSVKMTIDSSGNVGIGTDPNNKLHVRGSDTTSCLVVGNTTENTQFEVIPYQDDKIILRSNDGGSARNLTFETGTTERMRIASSGNVGIGTTSLTEKIEVNGSINTKYQSVNFGTGSKRGFFDCYAGGNQVRFGATSGSATDGMDLLFYTSVSGATSTTERMRIDSSGNVGIGTSSPSYKLETKDGDISAVTFGSASGGTSVNGIRFRINNSASSSQFASLGKVSAETESGWGGSLIFSTKPANGSPNESVTEQMQIDSSGRILKPNQPFFSAVWNQSSTGFVGGTYNVIHNNGGFTQTSGKIYVPTAGWYYINAYGIATDSFDTRCVANTTSSAPFLFDFRQSTYASGTHHGCGNGRVVYLASGSYVGIYRLSGSMYTSASTSNPHNLISIMLMG